MITTIRKLLTLRNLVTISIILLVATVSLYIFGYIIWRRFPIPTFIIVVGILGWRIGYRIGHAGLSRILNATSVGLGIFGLILWLSAVVDGWFFPQAGYFSWTTHVTMWGWILYHVWRAWRILNEMPAERLIHVTEGTEAIYAQMTYREARSREAREAYEKVKRQFNFAPTSV